MPRNSLITLLGTELTTTRGNQKINYQILYKMVESAIEEILLEYPNDPVVEELKSKIITNLQPVLKQIIPND